MKAIIFALSLSCIIFSTMPAGAHEEYAQRTGKECGYCHLSRYGGGDLTAHGKHFERHHSLSDINPEAAEATHGDDGGPTGVIWLASGLVHRLVAIVLFGAFLYVFLKRKPAYALQGLPRNAMRAWLASLAVMALTGAILAHSRIASSEELFQTSFGVLFLIKIGLFAILAISALMALCVTGHRPRAHQVRISFFTAYLNLAAVVLIILIVAFWRWQ